MDPTLFENLTFAWIVVGVLVFPLTLWLTAPFGRHFNARYGPAIGNRLGWVIMESPAIWWFTLVFVAGVSGGSVNGKNFVAWVLWSLWMIHYLNRGLVFPLRIRTTGKQIPLLVIGFGFSFQMVNGLLNGLAIGQFGSKYNADWLMQPIFWIGLALLVLGWMINVWSDEILLRLRKPNETAYLIPRGGLFQWVSCPNFLGEMMLWSGWAILCWNWAALSFAVWTIANLLPRALAHHRWYRQNFPDYPANRKAVFPGLL
jgi:protein-S-isoprenylcysteine O-methyltransferase Ste14